MAGSPLPLVTSSDSRALAEVTAGLISRKVKRTKHAPETLQHTLVIEKYDIFLEHVFLNAKYDSSREELEFLLWRFSITALLLLFCSNLRRMFFAGF